MSKHPQEEQSHNRDDRELELHSTRLLPEFGHNFISDVLNLLIATILRLEIVLQADSEFVLVVVDVLLSTSEVNLHDVLLFLSGDFHLCAGKLHISLGLPTHDGKALRA